MSRTIVVMAKAITPGRVKTRLSPPYTPEQAALLYTAFLEDVVDVVSKAGTQTSAGCVLFVGLEEGDSLQSMQQYLPQGWRLAAQPDGDLAQRMEAARAFADSEQVLIVGSDAPHMDPQRLVDAFEQLKPGVVVVGPTEDGGYDCIGLCRADKAPFEGVRWSTSDVFEQTRTAADSLGLWTQALSLGFDLDRADDLDRLKWVDAEAAPKTRAALGTLGL